MVSVGLPISNFSCFPTMSLETAPSALIIISITVFFLFHNFLSSLAMFKYFIIIILFICFSHWTLSDIKFQVTRTLLSILADLSNAVVRMGSIRSLISKSSSLCTNPFGTVSNALITIGISVTFMFHSFFQLSSKVLVLISLFASFSFTLGSAKTAKSTIRQILFFFFFFVYHWVWSFGPD